MHRLVATNLAKWFGTRKVFSKINFELVSGESMAITGPNGSGKSTLLSILLSVNRPTRGQVEYFEDDNRLDENMTRSRISLVAPYLNLYDHLSAEENIKFFATFTQGYVTGKTINSLLERVGLEGRGNDHVAGYSSGMKQRLKYAIAILNSPEFLFLDEPTANLDDDGKKAVKDIIEEYRSKSIMLIATNEKEEASLAAKECRLDK